MHPSTGIDAHGVPPQLDTLETTGFADLPSSYQNKAIGKDEAEYEQAVRCYLTIDEEEGTHRAESLLDCRTIAYFARHEETGRVSVISNSCRLRWCPICARYKTYMIRDAVREWIKTVKSPKFLTLTYRHSKLDLKTQVDNLYKHFLRFRKIKSIRKKIRGGLWFFELKKGKKDGLWHPHIHCVIDADYIPKEHLSLEWFGTTGHSYIIDIRKVKSDKEVTEYVSKYVAKPASLSNHSVEDALQIIRSFHGRRLCGTWGCGSKCKFRPHRREIDNGWKRIAAWNVLVANRRNSPSAERIIKAYLSGQPITQAEAVFVKPSEPSIDLPSRRWHNELSNGQAIFKEFW